MEDNPQLTSEQKLVFDSNLSKNLEEIQIQEKVLSFEEQISCQQLFDEQQLVLDQNISELQSTFDTQIPGEAKPQHQELQLKKKEIIEEYNRKVNLLNYKKVILLHKYEQKLDILITKKRELLSKLVCLHTSSDTRSIIDLILYAAADGMLPNFELSDYQAITDGMRQILANNLQYIDERGERKEWLRQKIHSLCDEDRAKLITLSKRLRLLQTSEIEKLKL